MTIHIERILTEYVVTEGKEHYGMIEQVDKDGYLQWVFMPTQKTPTTIIQLTEVDMKVIAEHIRQLNRRDHLPQKR